jgi:ankyrin repeat protein
MIADGRCYQTGLTLQRGQSALYRASFTGKTECVKVLLKYGAQVDLPVRCDVMHRNGSRVEVFSLAKLGSLVRLGWTVFDTEWEGLV